MLLPVETEDVMQMLVYITDSTTWFRYNSSTDSNYTGALDYIWKFGMAALLHRIVHILCVYWLHFYAGARKQLLWSRLRCFLRTAPCLFHGQNAATGCVCPQFDHSLVRAQRYRCLHTYASRLWQFSVFSTNAVRNAFQAPCPQEHRIGGYGRRLICT